jgi:radical SAM superfamily enzyme YgiQ (UPF0313 family)
LKILLVTHDIGYTDNIAIAFLSAIAKQLNHLTYYCSTDKEDLSSKILEIKPDVVGYSVNICGYERIIEEHKKVKKLHNFVSIMGGPFPTMSQDTFKESEMDAYCIGEGEYPFKDFLNCAEKGKSFDDVANLITKKGNNPVRPLISNLDELPMPDRDLIFSKTFLGRTPKKTFFTSRGCPYGCSYCCNNHFNKMYRGKGPIVRRFSVERVLKEIEDVKSKYRTDFVKFDDDCFALKADSWLEEFAEKYPKRIGIPFNCVIRLDVLDDKMLKLLKKAGCFSVHLSVDSTSEYIREKILHRKMKKDIAEKLRSVRKHGINTYVNYMTAIPESTLQDDLNTISMSKKAKITYPAYTTTVPLEGTDLYDYCEERGFLPDALNDDEVASFYDKSSLTCFSQRDKNIRLNINFLGAIIAKLPFPFDKLMIQVIKIVPPNKYFKKMGDIFYKYNIENKIYKFPKDAI